MSDGRDSIAVDREAPPVARVLAATLRRALQHPNLASTLRKLEGRFAIRSSTDPQAATIRFAKEGVEVVGGVDADADVVVTADLATMGEPGAPKPKVAGAARHPLLALQSSKLLEPPPPTDWKEAARDFMRRADGRNGMPTAVRVVNVDDGSDLFIGDAVEPELELYASGPVLIGLFTGSVHPGEAWFAGKLKILGSIAAMSRFAGIAQDLMFGQ